MPPLTYQSLLRLTAVAPEASACTVRVYSIFCSSCLVAIATTKAQFRIPISLLSSDITSVFVFGYQMFCTSENDFGRCYSFVVSEQETFGMWPSTHVHIFKYCVFDTNASFVVVDCQLEVVHDESWELREPILHVSAMRILRRFSFMEHARSASWCSTAVATIIILSISGQTFYFEGMHMTSLKLSFTRLCKTTLCVPKNGMLSHTR